MKYLITILLLTSCSVQKNTDKAVEWLNRHEKPIWTGAQYFDEYKYPAWTFIDSTGQVYYAGETLLTLPDTIK